MESMSRDIHRAALDHKDARLDKESCRSSLSMPSGLATSPSGSGPQASPGPLQGASSKRSLNVGAEVVSPSWGQFPSWPPREDPLSAPHVK
jgi:hypothetical protein